MFTKTYTFDTFMEHMYLVTMIYISFIRIESL